MPILRTQMLKVIATSLILATLSVDCALVQAQVPKQGVGTIQLGAQLTRIPAPDGFEEATSQFEHIKNYFASTEDPGNAVLAAHLPRADCEQLRAGNSSEFGFYTKVSVRKANREVDYSAQRFAALVAEFRKSGANYLDINSPTMKAAIARLGKGASELHKEKTQIDLSQPLNLGEFDTRPNVYSVMLMVTIKSLSATGEQNRPIVGGLSYVRVGQRLLYVYTYRTFESQTDVEVLRDFTKKWIGQILAAN